MATVNQPPVFQLTTAPMQQPQSSFADDIITNSDSDSEGCVLPERTIRITRMFDVRRVLNSETELRLSFDVPSTVSPRELQVSIDDQSQEQPNCYVLRVSCANSPTAKTFPLNAESIELEQLHAVLRTDTNELEIIAPKKMSTGTLEDPSPLNPFMSAVGALQSMVLSVSSAAWNTDMIVRKIPVTIEASL